MNYIKRLQKEAKAKDAKIAALEEGLRSIESYLSLPKFQAGDRLKGYVNISDVLIRIAGIRSAAKDAEEEALIITLIEL